MQVHLYEPAIFISGDFMCTAVTYKTKDFYFGRTLDNDFSYHEQVTVTPRNFVFSFRNGKILEKHYAITGMAYVCGGYPLYYDAMNEKGLCMAGLNFVGNAFFGEKKEGRDNVAVFEFIPWILSECESVEQTREKLSSINLTNEQFNAELPTAELHWIIADKKEAITVECTKEGMKIYDNPLGVLTNNPPFPFQLQNLNNYMHLSAESPENTFSQKLRLERYSRGMGGLGLPGDLSSQSRFVRTAFVKLNSISGEDENESVSQFFHILGSVHQQRGCCKVGDKYEITIYTSCMNADKGIYYYTTYENRGVSAVDMTKENLDNDRLIGYELDTEMKIKYQNKKGVFNLY